MFWGSPNTKELMSTLHDAGNDLELRTVVRKLEKLEKLNISAMPERN